MPEPHVKIIMTGGILCTIHVFHAEHASFEELAIVFLGNQGSYRSRQHVHSLLKKHQRYWKHDSFSTDVMLLDSGAIFRGNPV